MADPARIGKETPDKETRGDPVSAFYISGSATTPVHRPRVLKQGECLAVLDDFGDAQATAPSAEGLFFEDTRHLSQLIHLIDDTRPLLLSASVTEDNSLFAADLANPDLGQGGKLRLPRDTVHLRKTTVLGETALFEELVLHNFGTKAARFRLGLVFAADFVDMFEVRGTTRLRRGELLPPQAGSDGAVLSYRGLDGVVRRTRLVFDPQPEQIRPGSVQWQLVLPPGGTQTIEVAVCCERDDRPAKSVSRTESLAIAKRRTADRQARSADLYTSNESFNDWINRSRADLDMLVTETPEGLYAYAGIPWFSTAFGRDGIIAALQCLWLDPQLAAGTLRFLAARQAVKIDAAADAEPGKILHETRRGEMADLHEVPFGRYYGSVDATPLFVVLAAAYHARTGDTALIRVLWPNIEAALGWMASYGDADGDGFLEYGRTSVNGLINQGWKDSGDSIFHADGVLATGPIALVEVQAYAFAAYHGAAALAKALARDARAVELEAKAQVLQARFEAAFWREELGSYAIALDGGKRPCSVRTSNAGHVLFAGLASPEHAARVAETLMNDESFSQWGIRTVASGQVRYNPMSYHDGSVWPHDNSLIAMGFARYGLSEPLHRLFTGLFDAALFLDGRRLPELFCGFERRPGMGPVSYPVACIPQAWASGAVLAVTGAALGITFLPQRQTIRFDRPMLPSWLDEVRLANLRIGEASADVRLHRSGGKVALDVLRQDGAVTVELTT